MGSSDDDDDFENLLIPNNSLENCFICGVLIKGKHYSVASTYTTTTNSTIAEKLGQILKGKYMVIVSELDMICVSCANLIDMIDREDGIQALKNIVLRFLEKKYNLEPGELVGSSRSGNSTPSGSGTNSATGTTNKNESFMSKKRKAALTSNLDFENNQENTPDNSNNSDEESNTEEVWMQCDGCKYTTPYNSFVNNHIKHISKKSCLHCNYCFGELKDGNCAKNCDKNKTGFPNIQNNESSIQLKEENINNSTGIENVTQEETVELISPEINDYNNRTNADSNTPMMSTSQEDKSGNRSETILLPELSSNCSQPILIDAGPDINHNIQQNEVKNICDSVQVTSQTSNLFSNPNTLSSRTKQLLTVGDDGSVKIVPVVWGELVKSGKGTFSF